MSEETYEKALRDLLAMMDRQGWGPSRMTNAPADSIEPLIRARSLVARSSPERFRFADGHLIPMHSYVPTGDGSCRDCPNPEGYPHPEGKA